MIVLRIKESDCNRTQKEKTMKLLFLGDSITDMGRKREPNGSAFDFGVGYVFCIASELLSRKNNDYQIINRGISGDRIVSLYERVKPDVWEHEPDLLTVLIGINDIWHDLSGENNGVELPRFEKVYRNLIEETKERLPDVKIILAEPFVLKGSATQAQYEDFLEVKKYAKAIEQIAQDYGLYFLPLQKAFDEAIKDNKVENYLCDGVHPNAAGAKLIATEWLKLFDSMEN